MKLTAAITLLLIAGTAHASSNAYIGADVAFLNETDLNIMEIKVTHANNMSFNLVGGYAFEIADSFQVGLEAEYRNFGEATFLNVLEVKGSAFFINAKPIYNITDNIYVAATLGLGQMDLELKDTETGLTESETNTAFQLGLESGYQFNNSISLNFGYRSANANIDDIEVRVRGVYAGARYNF
ncbi:porin family protein [Vibrio aestuarianus]|uniref:outer membrane beta-barrel protein n=1 Tax=Vibrio aestuarianus TaxID=28171 RepID=UPI00237C8E16|nr:outer membrane beta-barrel protein [Vibrio aestuarianus]MDE1351535.1 porin family protein [Vibrio aestuarianus]